MNMMINISFIIFEVLIIEPRASYILDKSFATHLYISLA